MHNRSWDSDRDTRARAEKEREAYRNAKPNGAGQAIWVDDGDWDEALLPVRPWAVPGYALRGAVTLVVGPPSAKKSTLMLTWGCAFALGRPHGYFGPTESGTVVIYNCEDNRDEQRRRLSAVLRQFEAEPADIRAVADQVDASRKGFSDRC